MKCIQCKTEFYYCPDCGYDDCMSRGFCSGKCEMDFADWESFEEFFDRLKSMDDLIERRILNDCLDELWDSWIYYKKNPVK